MLGGEGVLNFVEIFVLRYFTCLNKLEGNKKLEIFQGGDDFFVWGSPFFGQNILARIELGNTPNFAALSHVEVP